MGRSSSIILLATKRKLTPRRTLLKSINCLVARSSCWTEKRSRMRIWAGAAARRWATTMEKMHSSSRGTLYRSYCLTPSLITIDALTVASQIHNGSQSTMAYSYVSTALESTEASEFSLVLCVPSSWIHCQ
jgi:hypothetical protein